MAQEASDFGSSEDDSSVEISSVESFEESFEKNSLYRVVDKHSIVKKFREHVGETENNSEDDKNSSTEEEIEFSQDNADDDGGFDGEKVFEKESAYGDEEVVSEIVEDEFVDPASGAGLSRDGNPTEAWQESNLYSTASTDCIDVPITETMRLADSGADEKSDPLEIPGIDDMSSLEELSIGDKSAGESTYAEIAYDRRSVQSLLSSSEQKVLAKHASDWDYDDENDSGSEESSVGDLGLDDTSLAASLAASLDAFYRPASRSSLMASLDGQKNKTPSLFVGREDELEILRYALGDVDIPGSDNPQRLIWITGPGGIGKSALAEEFIRTDVVAKGFLIGRGSFEEKGHGTTPFAALIDCLMDITDQLMEVSSESSEESDELSEYKEFHESNAFKGRILEDLKDDTHFIRTFLPSFSLWLGIDWDKTEEHSFDLTTGRLFDRARFDFRRVLRSLCRYQKICLFLDDIHSADEDSLRLIDTVLSTYGLKNFIFIGCHRGVKATHLLPKMKKKFSSLNAADVMLELFEEEDADHLIHRVLDEAGLPTKDEDIESLSSFVFEKGGGNPFNLKQLTLYLVDKGHIKLNKGKLKLKNQFFRSGSACPSTSIDIAFERIMLLSDEAQLALKSAGFLGVMFFRVEILYQAIGLLVTIENNPLPSPIDDVEDINLMLTGAVEAGLVEDLSGGNYCFIHDTIRKAATRMLPKEKKEISLLHYEFADQLFQSKSDKLLAQNPDLKEEVNVALVDHFGAATEHQKSAENRTVQAKLNLELAESAMWKGSFALAAQRAQTGIGFLDTKRKWRVNYKLTVKLHTALARIKFCQKNYKEAKINADEIINNGKNERDKVSAYDLLINISIGKKEFEEAFDTTLLALKVVWSEVPSTEVEEEVRIIRTAVNAKTDEDILTLPPMEHRKIASKMNFLARLAEVSWCCHDYLHQDLAALRMVQLSLKHGSSTYTNLAFSLYGLCLSRRGLHREAFRFGQLAEVTAELDTTPGAQASTFYHFGISYWGKPFESSLEPLQKAATVALSWNDMENLPFRTGAFLSHSFVAGANLRYCDTLFRKFKEYAIAFGGRDCWHVTLPYKLYLTLRGDSLDPAEKGFENVTDTRSSQYWIFFRMILAVFMQELDKAEKLSRKLFLKPEGVWVPYRGFLEGLIAADLSRKAKGKARTKHQGKAAKTVEVLSSWAKKGMTQAFHMANLVNAELRMSIDTRMDTRSCCALYNTAIDAAARAGFVHHEALANERAGMSLFSQHEEQLAAQYLTRARQLYDIWGAKKKVNLLNFKYSRLFGDESSVTSPISLERDTMAKDPFEAQEGKQDLNQSNDGLHVDHSGEDSSLNSDFNPPVAIVDIGGRQETNLSPVNSPSRTRPHVVMDRIPGDISGLPERGRVETSGGRMPFGQSQARLPSRRNLGGLPVRGSEDAYGTRVGTPQPGPLPGRGTPMRGQGMGERGRSIRGRGPGRMGQTQKMPMRGPPTMAARGPTRSPMMAYPQRGPRMMGRGPSRPPLAGRAAGRTPLTAPRPTGMGYPSNVTSPGSNPQTKAAANWNKLRMKIQKQEQSPSSINEQLQAPNDFVPESVGAGPQSKAPKNWNILRSAINLKQQKIDKTRQSEEANVPPSQGPSSASQPNATKGWDVLRGAMKKQAKPAAVDNQHTLTNVISVTESSKPAKVTRKPLGTAQKQSSPKRGSFMQSVLSSPQKRGSFGSFMVSPKVLAETSKSKGNWIRKALGKKEKKGELQFLSPPSPTPVKQKSPIMTKSPKFKGPTVTRRRQSIAIQQTLKESDPPLPPPNLFPNRSLGAKPNSAGGRLPKKKAGTANLKKR